MAEAPQNLANLTPSHEATGGVQLPVRIIDMGAQLVDVISAELVERGIANEIIPFTLNQTKLDVDYLVANSQALIFSGSGESVHGKDAPQIPAELLDGRIPIMAFCYGAQNVAHVLGGQVATVEHDGHHLGEYGQTTITVDPDAVIYQGMKRRIKVLDSHGDSIVTLPEGFRETAHSDDGVLESYESTDGRIVCTQFHPEAADTEDGIEMIMRFLTGPAGIEPDPSYTLEGALDTYMEKEEDKIRQSLENDEFIAGFLSGGVDSRVAAAAVLKVATELDRLDQVRFFYVETGHNRVEDDDVVAAMQAEGVPVETLDRTHQFFHNQVELEDENGNVFLSPPLVEADDPELKRAIIGTNFAVLSDEIIVQLEETTGRVVKIMQGTNNSDLIESGGRGGKKIKGHHNVGAMDKKRQAGDLIEPLVGLMKYHVRYLAESRYGLPHEFASRQPLPGVGISPRIVVNRSGELPPTDPEQQTRLDDMIKEVVGDKIKAHMVTIHTVGVKGDDRSLAGMVVLEGEADWEQLDEVSRMITGRFANVNRVLYSHEPIDRAKIRGARAIDDERYTAELKRIEEVHRQAMLQTNLDPYLSQHFVATLGVDLHGTGKPTLAVRLFITGKDHDKKAVRRSGASKETFRTGVAAMPGKQIDEAGYGVLIDTLTSSITDHGAVIYDLTGKPPGSTEFE